MCLECHLNHLDEAVMILVLDTWRLYLPASQSNIVLRSRVVYHPKISPSQGSSLCVELTISSTLSFYLDLGKYYQKN